MRYWWVNQNQTFRAEVRGSFMWSPKLKADGSRNQFYENMREVSPGDIVFSFCDTRIKAIGIVTGRAQTGLTLPFFGRSCLPHIDHLFDEGYITFSNSQGLIVVPEVKDTLLDAWGIDAAVRVGEFSREQSAFLDYHRVNVFKRELLDD